MNFLQDFKTKIIAEIGNNHLGSFDLAIEHCEKAAQAGADAVKFQYIIPENLVQPNLETLPHVKALGDKYQLNRWKKVCLAQNDFDRIVASCQKIGIEFMCTPFCFESLEWVASNCNTIKISSGDSNFIPLIKRAIEKSDQVIISTGLSNKENIEELRSLVRPQQDCVMHCVSTYPHDLSNSNLGQIEYLKSVFTSFVGFSDHTVGTTAPMIAIGLNVYALEKHFITDKSLPAGDAQVSATPAELYEIVRFRDAFHEQSSTHFTNDSLPLRKIMRRGVYAKSILPEGSEITLDDLKFIRPEVVTDGIMELVSTGSKFVTTRNLKENEPLTFTDILVLEN